MKTILVADDDPVGRELIREILESQGYQVTEAGDGASAISAIQAAPPDLVLLDIQMPVLDGFGVIQALRREHQFQGIPVFALTAFAMRGDQEKALAAGFDGYIAKPINVSAFRELIRQALSRAG
jgi:two-component system cell cycle response regulator DivK